MIISKCFASESSCPPPAAQSVVDDCTGSGPPPCWTLRFLCLTAPIQRKTKVPSSLNCFLAAAHMLYSPVLSPHRSVHHNVSFSCTPLAAWLSEIMFRLKPIDAHEHEKHPLRPQPRRIFISAVYHVGISRGGYSTANVSGANECGNVWKRTKDENPLYLQLFFHASP